MKQELIDQALASFDAIIRDELEGTDPQKYTRIIAVAVQAHRMRRNTRRRDRVADHAGMGVVGAALPHHMMYAGPGGDDELRAAMNGEIGEDVAVADGFAQQQLYGIGGRGFRHQPDMGDTMDVIREALATLKPVVDPFDRAAKKLRALSEARTALRDAGGDTTAIDAKIRELTANLTDDPKEISDAHPALVHSELLRRHQTRGADEDQVPRDRGEDDGARARGLEGTGGGGIETTVVADVDDTNAPLQ